ncbi:MAG: class I SAM-dependent methyltransferase [Pelobacteraceae bacterium]
MPVDTGLNKEGMIYQRDQYAKGGLGVRYWDYRDRVAFQYIIGKDILDAGCGEGITLEKLTMLFPDCTVVGIDTEPENLELCRSYNLPVLEGSLYSLPFADASFDTVLFSEVIEHLEKPEKALSEIWRVLRPGGRVIIIFPNDRTFMLARLAMGMVREALYDPGHVRQWTPGQIRKSLCRTGFIPVSARSIPFLFWQTSLHHVSVGEKRCDSVGAV